MFMAASLKCLFSSRNEFIFRMRAEMNYAEFNEKCYFSREFKVFILWMKNITFGEINFSTYI